MSRSTKVACSLAVASVIVVSQAACGEPARPSAEPIAVEVPIPLAQTATGSALTSPARATSVSAEQPLSPEQQADERMRRELAEQLEQAQRERLQPKKKGGPKPANSGCAPSDPLCD